MVRPSLRGLELAGDDVAYGDVTTGAFGTVVYDDTWRKRVREEAGGAEGAGVAGAKERGREARKAERAEERELSAIEKEWKKKGWDTEVAFEAAETAGAKGARRGKKGAADEGAEGGDGPAGKRRRRLAEF